MKLNQIYYVMEIARVGSMNQAAKNLYVSQPHLSSTVAELEKLLNITIFKRTSKGVELTPVGSEFVKACHYILDQLEYIQQLYSYAGNEELTLTVTSNCHNTVASSVILELTEQEKNNCTHFSFLTASSLSILTDVSEQKYNVGLIVMPELEEPALQGILNAKRLQFHCLRRENGCIMVGRSNPLYNEPALTIRRCADYPIVMLNDDWERTFNAVEVASFKHRYTVADKESLFNCVLRGNCIAIADPTVNRLSNYVASGDIRLIPLEEAKHMSYYVGWVSRKNAELTAIEQRFIDRYEELLDVVGGKKDEYLPDTPDE